MTTQTHFTDEDFRVALRQGVPASVVTRQIVRQAKEQHKAVKLELKAGQNDVTAIYFPHEVKSVSLFGVLISWIKKVTR